MEQYEMVNLLRGGIPTTPQLWADFGAGTGNFSWALAELLANGSTIYALDRDAKAIRAQQERLAVNPPPVPILPILADVTKPLQLPLLNGILMANLLHFLRDQARFLRSLTPLLHTNWRILVVEYEQATPIPWVPFPMPFATLRTTAGTLGWHAHMLNTRQSPSSGRMMYAASLTAHQVDEYPNQSSS
ncbi:MAG: hypothetical protein Fur005_29680 [Roseiflexaceae bacterium]